MLKNRTKIGSAVDKALYKKVPNLAKETRIPISKLLDEAIEILLSKHNQILYISLYPYFLC
ncbi:MAG: ribbon-helix-helix domain-containing protein [Romboutsia sp.]